MYSELLARIVLSSSICEVVLQLLSPTLFCQCGYISFCSLRVLSLLRMLIRHLLIPRVPQAYTLHLVQLSFFSSLSLAVSRRVCLCTHSSFPFPSRPSHCDHSDSFSTFVVAWFSRSSMRCHAQPGHNLQCDREPRCQPTKRRIFFFPPQSLAMEVPLLPCQLRLSLSTSNQEPPFGHCAPHKPSQFDHDDQQRFLESFGLN